MERQFQLSNAAQDPGTNSRPSDQSRAKLELDLNIESKKLKINELSQWETDFLDVHEDKIKNAKPLSYCFLLLLVVLQWLTLMVLLTTVGTWGWIGYLLSKVVVSVARVKLCFDRERDVDTKFCIKFVMGML